MEFAHRSLRRVNPITALPAIFPFRIAESKISRLANFENRVFTIVQGQAEGAGVFFAFLGRHDAWVQDRNDSA